ncbi:MAG: cellulase family glycosylhydrolase, partial [Calditrichia bacterium]
MKIKIFVLIMIFTAGFAMLPQSGNAFFHTDGKQIIDLDGNPILLQGMGLGGWLVPEGYMLKIPGYGSPTYIDSLVEDLIGPQNRDQFWQIYRDNYVNRSDILKLGEWGFNSIRLPFHYKLFYDTTAAAFRPEGFALLDSLLDWCAEAEIYVVLDMHCAPGGQNKDNISDSDGIEARLWTNPANRTLTMKIWKEIAGRYVNETRIIGYDLINEPVLPSGYSNAVLQDFYVQLTDTIRQVDNNHIVFIEGNWYATDFSQLTPPFDNNMVYSFHKYWNDTNVGTIQYLLDISNQYNVPLWMGESGENSNPWFWEAVRLFEQYNIGWCWWTHKKIATLTSPRSAPLTAGYETVLNYWRGQTPRPSQSFAKNALFEMAGNLALPLCEERPGVLRALFDSDFGNQSHPFGTNNIPGTLYAVDYDFGSNAAGYKDEDFKNVQGPGGATWNQGWEYRNDGVDIEVCQDTSGPGYDVGWIEANEWLKFTVNVLSGGDYTLKLRVA